MKTLFQIILIVLFLGIAPSIFAQGTFKLAKLGNFQLENGQTIQDCELGYRTFGTINQNRSNVILFSTYFMGTSNDLTEFIQKNIDTSKYCVIAVDAFGNGVSSSPSTSKKQPGRAFPQFTIRDLVQAQHQLLEKELGLKHILAVMGISMGGMQTFQWVTTYPGFVDKAVSIVGTPRQTAYDLLLWQTELNIIEAARGSGAGEKQALSQAMRTVAALQSLALTTPQNVVAQVKPEDFSKFISDLEKRGAEDDPYNYAGQLRAMIKHDVFKPFDGSLEKTAAAVQAKMLIIVAQQDHMVNPAPSREFAKALKAETIELTSDCGHIAFTCETGKIKSALTSFLNK